MERVIRGVQLLLDIECRAVPPWSCRSSEWLIEITRPIGRGYIKTADVARLAIAYDRGDFSNDVICSILISLIITCDCLISLPLLLLIEKAPSYITTADKGTACGFPGTTVR